MSRNCLAGVYAVILIAAWAALVPQTDKPSSGTFIHLKGLKPEYASCELVDFSVQNISGEMLYVEVYAETYTAGSWRDDIYPYAINDPNSLYSKMVKASRIQKGRTLQLSYDRCLKPKFVEESAESLRLKIRAADNKATTDGAPTEQRFRIMIRFDNPSLTEKAWSDSLRRVP